MSERRAVPLRRANPSLHHFVYRGGDMGLHRTMPFVFVVLPYLLVLLLLWVLLAGQPAATAEYQAKMRAQEDRISSQATQITYLVNLRLTPAPVRR